MKATAKRIKCIGWKRSWPACLSVGTVQEAAGPARSGRHKKTVNKKKQKKQRKKKKEKVEVATA